MFQQIKKLFRRAELSDFEASPDRERLIASCRILFVDDEHPLLLDELTSARFAVDHDHNGDDTRKIDSQIYDVIVLDFHGVGQRLGANQGLALLKHIRRVSPRSRVIAYTSRSLTATESDFFRLSHAVLSVTTSIFSRRSQMLMACEQCRWTPRSTYSTSPTRPSA